MSSRPQVSGDLRENLKSFRCAAAAYTENPLYNTSSYIKAPQPLILGSYKHSTLYQTVKGLSWRSSSENLLSGTFANHLVDSLFYILFSARLVPLFSTSHISASFSFTQTKWIKNDKQCFSFAVHPS